MDHVQQTQAETDGQALRQRRKARGWSQSMLSARIQCILTEEGHTKTVSAAVIGKYERGETNPGDAIRNAINYLFEVNFWSGDGDTVETDLALTNPFNFSILKDATHLIYRPSYDENNIICALLELNATRNRFICTHKSGSGSLQCVSGDIDIKGQHLFLAGTRDDTGIKELYSFQIMLPQVVQNFLVGLCIASTYDGNIYATKVYGEPSRDKTRDYLINTKIGTWLLEGGSIMEHVSTYLMGSSDAPVLKYD